MDKLTSINGHPVLAQRPGVVTRSGVETVVVLCWLQDNPITPFVTWEAKNDKDAFWGHYHSSIGEAGKDFEERDPRPDEFGKRGFPMNFAVDTTGWELTGPKEDQGAQALAVVSFFGVPHHIEAIAVHPEKNPDGTEYQRPDDPEVNLDAYQEAFQPGADWQSVRIRGRDYLFFMEPFS